MRYRPLTLLSRLIVCTCGLALLLLLPATSLWAQTPYFRVDIKRNRVVAVSGLNLRDAPSLQGRVLTKVPFGGQVRIISDTAFAYANYESPEVRDHNCWFKASYDGHIGYLFDAYLFHPPIENDGYNEGDIPAGMNEDYRLFTNRGSVNLNYDHFGYEWLGLYAGQGNCTLSSIRPSYRYYPGEIEETLEMTVNDGRPLPVFFIAGKKGWKTGVRPGTINLRGGTAEAVQAASMVLCAEYGISVKPGKGSSWAASHEFTLSIDGKNQVLNPGGRAGDALYVEAATDLDGDGRPDFIISYNADGYDYTVIYALFLSSEAREGELVRPVAVHYVYNGC